MPLTFVLLFSLASAAVADERVDRLSEEHKSWLEREVVYIITDQEREVFLTLETLDERNRFIEAFWRKRDPNPATPVNEFREEHYRRFEYANTYLGRDTFRDGWRTDRGRFYIILGEPREIQRFDGYAGLVSAHLWFYQGEPRLGTPAFFYLLFYRKNDFGEFRLYHPVIDGPAALLSGSATPTTETASALQALREVSAELARASLSFDPSEASDLRGGRPSIGTDMMIARIEDSPKRAIRTDYAAAGLRYGNRVSADYTFNFVPSRSAFSVLADPSGAALVHYSIEIDPQNFSLETDERQSKFYTTLDLTIEARTSEGTLVVGNDKEAYIEVSPSQMQEIRAHAFAYQDDFLLVPGDYNVTVIVRNRVLSQYTVAERELRIPPFTGETPQLTDLILAYDTTLVGGAAGEAVVSTYQVGNLRIHPAADDLFVIGNTLHAVTQVLGASAGHRVVFELGNDETILQTFEQEVGAASAAGVLVEHLKLDNLVGGAYRVLARLVSPAGETLSEKVAPLTLSPRSAAPRPGFVYRRGLNTRIPGLMSFMRGEQLWKLERFDEATAALEESIASGNDRLVPATWMLANAYLKAEQPDRALELLRPLEEPFGYRYEVQSGLGFAVYLKGDYEAAAAYLARAREIAPPDTMLLNALGDSYLRLGKLSEARAAFERSLELDAEQPAVKERLASLATPEPGAR